MHEPSSPSPSLVENLEISQLVRYLLLFALGWVTTQVLAYFETAIIVFIFAAIYAFFLDYPVRWVSRFLPRGIAVFGVFILSLLLLGGIVVTLGAAIVSQIQQLLIESPRLIDSVLDLSEKLQTLLSNWNLEMDFRALEEQFRDRALGFIETNLMVVQELLFSLIDVLLIAIIALFMLMDGRRIWQLLLKVFPPSIRPKVTTSIQSNLLGFFGGRLLLSLFFGISIFIVFLILGVPFAIALASIAAIFDLIPGVGATLGVALVSIILLPQGLGVSLKVLVICVILQQIEENILMPRIMQGSIDMNPVIMFLALLVGAKIAGVVGLFLSIPVAGVLISLFEIEELKGQRIRPSSSNLSNTKN